MGRDIDRLYRNRLIYELLMRDVLCEANKDVALAMQRIRGIASFAWKNHTGCFADARLEVAGQKLGADLRQWRLSDFSSNKRDVIESFCKKDGRKRILFVVSSLWKVGGHTRLFLRFLNSESSSKKLLVVIDQRKEDVWEDVVHQCKDSNIEMMSLSDLGLEDRAGALSGLRALSDFVHCFTKPDDPVPLVAFAQGGGSPVLFNNHAHFWYGIGTSVVDVCVSNRLPFMEHAYTFRYGQQHRCLPFPQSAESQEISVEMKKVAARRLGIPENVTVLLSAGTREKYLPGSRYDFFKTAEKVLATYPDVYLLVAGLEIGTDILSLKKLHNHPRFKLYGCCDLKPLYLAADIFLESFPISSLQAVQEAVACGGACPFFMYGTRNNLFSYRADKEFVSCENFYSRTEGEYIAKLGMLISQLSSRQATIIRDITAFLSDRSARATDLVDALYENAVTLSHTGSNPEQTVWDSSDYSHLLAEASPDISVTLLALRDVSIRGFLRILFGLYIAGGLGTLEMLNILWIKLRRHVASICRRVAREARGFRMNRAIKIKKS